MGTTVSRLLDEKGLNLQLSELFQWKALYSVEAEEAEAAASGSKPASPSDGSQSMGQRLSGFLGRHGVGGG